MTSRISPESFWKYFSDTVQKGFASDFKDNWDSRTDINDLMLSDKGDGGVLKQLMAKLSLPTDTLYIRERYTLDAAYVSGRAYPDAEPSKHPANLHALIEHEAADFCFDEIWKLCHWRTPFKVLITYDWPDPADGLLGITQRLTDHYNALLHILRNAESNCQEDPHCRYLFITGRQVEDEAPEWIALCPKRSLDTFLRL